MALTDKLTAIADSVRSKTGESKKYSLTEMPTEIDKMGSATDFDNYKKLISHDVTSVVIPDGVNKLAYSIFRSCKMLTSVAMPDSVVTIDTFVFSGCSALTSVTLSNKLNKLNEKCFENCTSLEALSIPSSVTTVHDAAFSGCTALKDVTLGNGFQASINLSVSTQYTADTIVSWLNALTDRTGQTALTLTMGATNLAKLTDEQKAIATDKNWNLE